MGWTVTKQKVGMWRGFIWLRIGIRSGLHHVARKSETIGSYRVFIEKPQRRTMCR
jgi:hypothetical protein